jgi:chromosomal replication initiator protein
MPASENEAGADMVDGVVDIPLEGRTVGCAAEQGGAVPACHFLAGPENRLVEVAVRAVVEGVKGDSLAFADTKTETAPYNPLVFCGPSGLGKSHLVHGLVAAWKARFKGDSPTFVDTKTGAVPRDRRQRVVCTTAVDFARELAEAIESQGVDEFREKYRGAHLLIVEDLGMLPTRKSGKLNAQEELLHTLDALVAENCWVVVTASAPPAALPGILPALQSRLTAGLVIPLAPPGVEARLAILRQLATARGLPLPEPVARVLAEGIVGTAPELAGSLVELAMSAIDSERETEEVGDLPEYRGDLPHNVLKTVEPAGNLPYNTCPQPHDLQTVQLDVEAARNFVAERSRTRQPTLHDIALATARHFSLRLSDLRSPVRRRVLVVARGVAIYLARRLTQESLQEIGRYFGGRDHTTVLHSCQKTTELLATDRAVREAIEQLQEDLGKKW